MQVFKAFWKIALKRISSIIIYIVIYAMITVIISSSAKDEGQKSFKDSVTTISITDHDDSVLSRGLKQYLESKCTVTEIADDKEAMQDSLFYRNVDYILMIPAGFEDSFLDNKEMKLENVKIPDSKTGQYTDSYIDRYLSTVNMYTAGGMEIDKAADAAAEALTNETSVTIYNSSDNSSDNNDLVYYFQYLPYIFLMVIVCGLCPIIIMMNSREIKNRTMCSSISSASRNSQIASGSILYSLIVWLVLMILAFAVYKEALFTKTGLLFILNSIIFLVVSASVALLISSFELSNMAVTGIANVIGLGMSFICGIFVPQTYLGSSLLDAAKFLPAYWYIKASNMLGGACGEVYDANEFTICIIIQVLFAAALFAVSFVLSRRKKA
ncbi:MAG: ABC transporter permease [Oscillospiraceae bacterium]|nr:ABC transporter permease [Oscillospiraceae bacterium]